MKEKIEDRVMDIIGGHSHWFLAEMESPSSRLVEDLMLDSLDAVEIVIDLEHEFDIHVEDDDILRMKTLRKQFGTSKTKSKQ